MLNEQSYIIVTGANGYLGKYVCLELIDKGYQIIAFKYPHYASSIIQHPNIQYIQCDISVPLNQQDELMHSLENKKISTIVNLAALLGSSDYNLNHAVNALGIKHLIDYASSVGIKRFIQISSVVILKKFKGPYGETKLEGQNFLINSDLDYTIFIPAMILGPEGLGINRILKNVFRFPWVVPLVGQGKQTQHPIFVKDFAHYIVKSIPFEKSFRNIYQIAGDQVVSFRGLISMILRIKNKRKIFIPIPPFFVKLLGHLFQKIQKVPLFTAEHVKGIMQSSRLDTRQIEKDLNFTPTKLEDALEYTLKEIGNNWNNYLKEREERIIKLS